jgi:hypothetical protein
MVHIAIKVEKQMKRKAMHANEVIQVLFQLKSRIIEGKELPH